MALDINYFTGELCKVLGLDADSTKSINIDIQPDCLIQVKVERYLEQDELCKIIELFKLERVELKKI